MNPDEFDFQTLYDDDEEAFNELWHLLELLLDRMPATEGMDA